MHRKLLRELKAKLDKAEKTEKKKYKRAEKYLRIARRILA